MSIEIIGEDLMEFEEVLRKKKKRTTIMIAYFKMHSNRRPLVGYNEFTSSCVFIFVFMQTV